MFRQMAAKRRFLDEKKKSPGVAVVIGVGKPKEEGGGGDAGLHGEMPMGGDEEEPLGGEGLPGSDRAKTAAMLAKHHQALADEYRAKAEEAGGGVPESPEEEAAESPEMEASEDEGAEEHLLPGEEDELDDGLALPKKKGLPPQFLKKKKLF